MEPNPAQIQGVLFLLWVSVPLFFMGVASLINTLVGRKMINGASIYLVLAAALFAYGAWKAFSNPANTSGDAAELIGYYIGYFIIPVGIAVYFADRFSKNKRSEITPRRNLRGLLKLKAAEPLDPKTCTLEDLVSAWPETPARTFRRGGRRHCGAFCSHLLFLGPFLGVALVGKCASVARGDRGCRRLQVDL